MSGNLSVRIGAIMLGGFVLMQALLALVLIAPGRGASDGTFGLPPPAAMAAMVDAIEAAGPAGADRLVRSYDGSLFTVRISDAAPPSYQEIPRAMRDLAGAYRQALASHNALVDGGPGWLHRIMGDRARPIRFLVPIRIIVWLRDGRVLVVTGRPGPVLRGFLAQRSILGFLGGGLLLLVLWLALRQTTEPLVRLTRDVRAFGNDLHAPDAAVEGSREVRALASAFNDMKGQIARLVEERTFILAGIAHDMRTYLTRLRLRVELMPDEPQRNRAVNDLDRMSALLDDSLLFADAAGAPRAAIDRVDLTALTRTLAAARTEAEHIELAMPQSCPVMADPGGLSRIFNNLVDNGLRHGRRIRVSAELDEGQCLWRFDDDGEGVPDGALAMLGQAFARIDPSRDRRTGGTGLGLAIVKALAGAMGGRTTFSRSPLGGLRVEIGLDRAASLGQGAAGNGSTRRELT